MYARDVADHFFGNPEATVRAGCEDDRLGSVAIKFGSCAALVSALGCDYDGAELRSDVFPAGFHTPNHPSSLPGPKHAKVIEKLNGNKAN